MTLMPTDRPTGSSLGELGLTTSYEDVVILGDDFTDGRIVELVTSAVTGDHELDDDPLVDRSGERDDVTAGEQTGGCFQVGNPTLAAALGKFDRAFERYRRPGMFINGLGSFTATTVVVTGQMSEDISLMLPRDSGRRDTNEDAVHAVHDAVRLALAGSGASAAVSESISAALRGHLIRIPRINWVVTTTGAAMRSVDVVVPTNLARLAAGVADPLEQEVERLEPQRGPRAIDDIVGLVENLSDRLGVPVRDVLAAAGVKPRTFYAWKKPNAPRPRVASQGRMWQLADAIDDLAEQLDGSVRSWFHAHPERLQRLRQGAFDELGALVTREQLAAHLAAGGEGDGTVAGPYGAGPDDSGLLDIPGTTRPAVLDPAAISVVTPQGRKGRNGRGDSR